MAAKQNSGFRVICNSVLRKNLVNLKKYIAELKKRHVFKAGLAYLIGAWVLTEVSALVLDTFAVPPYVMKTILIVLVIGFPIWLIFSWVYDLTPEGIKKTHKSDPDTLKSPVINHRLNRTIIGLLSIAVVLLVVNQLRISTNNSENKAGNRTPDEIATAEKPIELIAVLPFFNSKSDPETDYLGFAMADQIIGGLVYLQNMVVRPSASIRQYEHQRIDPKTVGEELQVDYILIGNYLKEDNVIRLNVELIHVHSNEIIWREPLQVDFQSAFELQDIVAKEVIAGMNVQFTQKELSRIRKNIPHDPLAYEYFLRSISYTYTNEGDQLAIKMLEKSIELDSTYAPAYYHLGDRLHRYAIYGSPNSEQALRSENALLKALSLNSEHMGALGNLAMRYTETDRIMEAVELTKQILEINPNSAEAHLSLGYIYRYTGMNDEAIREMEKAIALDSRNQVFRTIIITYLFAGKYEKAIEAGRLFEESAFIFEMQGLAHHKLGKNTEAVECLNRVIKLDPNAGETIFTRSAKAFIEGNPEEALSYAIQFEQFQIADAEAWYFKSFLYGMSGDKEGCIRCLRKAVDSGFFNYPLMSTDSYLDPAREDPEFQKVLQKAKEKHLAFKERFF